MIFNDGNTSTIRRWKWIIKVENDRKWIKYKNNGWPKLKNQSNHLRTTFSLKFYFRRLWQFPFMKSAFVTNIRYNTYTILLITMGIWISSIRSPLWYNYNFIRHKTHCNGTIMIYPMMLWWQSNYNHCHGDDPGGYMIITFP